MLKALKKGFVFVYLQELQFGKFQRNHLLSTFYKLYLNFIDYDREKRKLHVN